MTATNVDLSLILACYCDEQHLAKNSEIIADYLNATKLRFELIFVEDGSPDRTAQEIMRVTDRLGARGVLVQTILHSENKGRGASIQAGFRSATGAVIGFVDIDLEGRLDALLPMYLRIRDGACDGVIGKRLYSCWWQYPVRLAMSLGYRLLVRLCLNLPVSDTEVGFKFFRRESLLPVLSRVGAQGWFWDTEIVARCVDFGLRLVNHTIVVERSPTKQTTVKLFRDSYRQLTALVTFAVKKRDDVQITAGA